MFASASVDGITIQEIAPLEDFIKISLKEMDIRNRFGIQVNPFKEIIPDCLTSIPILDLVVKDSDILIGDEKSLEMVAPK